MTPFPDAPHAPLTADEYAAARRILDEAGHVTESTRFPLVLLDEPPRGSGPDAPRRVRATLLDIATGSGATAVVDLAAEGVAEYRPLPPSEGQAPVLFEEYERCDAIVKADARWQKAMADRGITDLSLVVATPLSAGYFGVESEEGRRLLRSLTFLRCDEDDNPWSHPVEGLLADVDMTENRVVELIDRPGTPTPTGCQRFDGEHAPEARTSTKPLEITQPEGPSFGLDGNALSWEGWTLELGFNAREGLTLHHLAFQGRPVLHRASIAEMAVPYADPDPTRNWICYFDAGEYSLGRNANSLRLGCDCLGEIRYVDGVMAGDDGNPYTVENAICLHEEDIGLQWKHTNIFTGGVDSRRARRMVVSFIATVGNYDYAFYWYLHQDGTIAHEVKATGVLFTSAGDSSPYASAVAPGLLAPYHQHLFCARLDTAIDGPDNSVEEIDAVSLPMGEANPRGNAFTIRATPVTGPRRADPSAGRRWRVVNPSKRNALGQPTAYTLVPQPGPVLLADPESPLARRAAFATEHLWVTPYAADRRFPAGDHPNQHPGGSGLPSWPQGGDNEPLTVWHVFGPTHLPRVEDWPVMPVDSAGFSFRPTGFLDANPTLDLAESAKRHCH